MHCLLSRCLGFQALDLEPDRLLFSEIQFARCITMHLPEPTFVHHRIPFFEFILKDTKYLIVVPSQEH